MAQDKITEVFDIPQIEKNIQDTLSSIKAILPELKKIGEELKSSTSIGSSGQTQAKAKSAFSEMETAAKDYVNMWKQLLKEKERAEADNRRLEMANTKEVLALRKETARQEAELRKLEIAGSKEAIAIQKELEKQKKAKEKASLDAIKAQSQEDAANEKAAKSATDLTNAYNVLNLKHKAAIATYQQYAATLASTDPKVVQAKDRANQLGDQLAKIDAGVGNYRRNVGNYSSAWNGLGNSINQITRELPNAAQSMQLFFLAISNNVPIAADEIARAKEQIKALKDEGKDAPSLFSLIAKSIFSWQTVLTIGITLLVKYGAEIVDWMSNVSDAEKMARKYQEALKDSIKSESDGIAKLYALKSALADTTNSRQTDLQAFNAAKKEYPQYFDYLNTEKASLEQINAVINAQIAARIENAKMAAYSKVQTEAIEEMVKAEIKLNEQFSIGERFLAGWAYDWKVTMNEVDFNKLSKEAQEYVLEQEKLYKAGKINIDVFRAVWVRAIDYTKAQENGTIATENLTKAIQDQNVALNSSYDNSIKKLETQVLLAKSGSKEELKAKETLIKEKLKLDEKELLQKYKNQQTNLEYIIEFNNLQAKAQKDLEGTKSSFDKKNNPKKERLKKDETADIILQQMNNVAENEQINIDKRLAAIRAELDAGLITIAQYQDKKKIIVKEGEDAILSLQIAALDDYLKQVGMDADGRAKVQEAITTKHKEEIKRRQAADEEASLQAAKIREDNLDFYNKLFKEAEDGERSAREAKIKAEQDEADRIKRINEEKQRYIQQIAQETSQLIFTLLDAQTQKEIAAAEKRSEAIAAEYDLKRNAIDQASISDEEKTARKLVLDAEEAESQKKIDNEIRALKIKQAKFDKAQALASIAINAAVAVSANLAPPTLGALTPLILGLAAAQAAVVLATPLPEYAKGKKASDGYEGLAIAGEKGTEMMIDKDGKIQMLTEPTLIHTRRGDTILSNEQLKKGAAEKYAPTKSDYSELVRAYSYNTERTVKAIREIPASIIFDNSVLKLNQKRASR